MCANHIASISSVVWEKSIGVLEICCGDVKRMTPLNSAQDSVPFSIMSEVPTFTLCSTCLFRESSSISIHPVEGERYAGVTRVLSHHSDVIEAKSIDQ